MAKLMSKSELIQKIAEHHPSDMTRKDVKGVIESLAEIGYKELKKTGAFFVPGFAKFVVIKKPATKARKGINPFTQEPKRLAGPLMKRIERVVVDECVGQGSPLVGQLCLCLGGRPVKFVFLATEHSGIPDIEIL